ncbi:MAG: hypothetical protein AB8B87_03920 [Granulosicoccus sp.]
MKKSVSQTVWQAAYCELHDELLYAHAHDDKHALVTLYTHAADMAELHSDMGAARFYLTQAFIVALEIAHPEHLALEKRLDAYHVSPTT